MIRNGRGRNSCVGGCASDEGVERGDGRPKEGWEAHVEGGWNPAADVTCLSIHLAFTSQATLAYEISREITSAEKKKIGSRLTRDRDRLPIEIGPIDFCGAFASSRLRYFGSRLVCIGEEKKNRSSKCNQWWSVRVSKMQRAISKSVRRGTSTLRERSNSA